MNENMLENTDSLKQNIDAIEDETQESVTDQEEFSLESNSVITDEYFEKTCEEIEEMNFIEVIKINNEFRYHKDSLEKAKESVEQIVRLQEEMMKSAESDSNLTNAIMEADAQSSHELDDLKAFLDSYDDTMGKLNALIEKSDERIHAFDDVEKTSSYLNNSMVEVIDKKLNGIKDDGSTKTKQMLTYYKEIRKIYEDRTNVDFLLERIGTKKIEVRRLKTSLKKDKSGNTLAATQKKVVGLLSKSFNTNLLVRAEEYLTELFGGEDEAFFFQYVLALIYEREKTHGKYGKHKWVEVLFMNIIDICTNKYDLEGGEEFYKEQLLKLRDELVKIL